MAFGLGDVLQTLQQGVQAINLLTAQIKSTFPQATTSSTSAPGSTGTITFTSSPDEPTFTFPVAITFQPGDVLEILAPSVPDAHMTLIAMTLVGTLP